MIKIGAIQFIKFINHVVDYDGDDDDDGCVSLRPLVEITALSGVCKDNLLADPRV